MSWMVFIVIESSQVTVNVITGAAPGCGDTTISVWRQTGNKGQGDNLWDQFVKCLNLH